MVSSGVHRAITLGLCGLLAGAGCARGLVGDEIGPAEATWKILLAVYPTEYKARIADGLVERFQGRAKVTRISVRELGRVDERHFDAVVIIDQLMAWQLFNFESSAFIRRIDAPDARRKIVLYLTAGSPKPDYRFKGIDAMTGATEMNREGDAVDAISARIEALLGHNP